MNKIKIGQIGVCHEHASGKINTLKHMPDVFEIVGVVDDNTSTAAKFAGTDLTPYEGLKWLTEEELFNTPGLQAVAVETPNLDLVPTALRCMERNLAMHMDKPGGEDLDFFSRLRKGCEERKLPFQMGYMFRNNPAMQWCLKAVRQGWLGKIFEVQGSMSHNYGGEAYQEYIGKFKGGIMFNLGCHWFDLIIAMVGRPESITPFLKSAPGFPDHIKNNCLTILGYPNATVKIQVCSLEIDGFNRRRFKVCGTKGSVELCPLERFDGQPLEMRLALLEGNEEYAAGTHIVDFGIKHDRYKDQLLELAKIINGEMENPYTYEHDYLVQEVLLAASGYTEWSK
ncbi:MAG: Gfo/Idh/MocA family oxidoreductase [Desulforhabdus sp.]|jgi:predicted dehydrogenase|nr:Gfo/Idh/MocA family oxidoreductase [Desulforhabdus sp.]